MQFYCWQLAWYVDDILSDGKADPTYNVMNSNPLYSDLHDTYVLMVFAGGVYNDGGSVPGEQGSPEDWVNIVNEVQMGALSSRLGIPMIYGADVVHGHTFAYGATIFPHNIGLGATRQVDVP